MVVEAARQCNGGNSLAVAVAAAVAHNGATTIDGAGQEGGITRRQREAM